MRRIRFLRRPNRYLAVVRDPELGLLEAHVPNPGRLRELLPPDGTFGHIVRARPPPGTGSPPRPRKTAWTLVSVVAPDDPSVLVSIDTGAARPLVDQALVRGDLRPLADWGPWRSEVAWGHHRFDHAVPGRGAGGRPLALLEVKSSNLKEGRTALFPDAPTVRGTSHVEALTRFVRAGGRAALLLLVQRDDVSEVRPYGAMDPAFARAFDRARAAGVLALGRALHVLPDGATWGRELPVGPPLWTEVEERGTKPLSGRSLTLLRSAVSSERSAVTVIPRSHPRYRSLVVRAGLAEQMQRGLVVPEGLMAHGRGEAFDYLLGERTSPSAARAERAAAARLLLARRPVLSVNGNVAALASREVSALARAVPGLAVEVNLFHRTPRRAELVAEALRDAGVEKVLGVRPTARLRGLASDRSWVDPQGILRADVVLVPLEDGDRAEALVRAGKFVIAVDLNPLSRTAVVAQLPLVDELTRALARVRREALRLRQRGPTTLRKVAEAVSGPELRREALGTIQQRLLRLSTAGA